MRKFYYARIKPVTCFLVSWAAAGLFFFGTAILAQAETQQLVISPDMQFSYADSLYKKADYATAEVEFKRFIHFFPGDPRTMEAEFKIGMALFYQERFYDAARQFDEIIRKEKQNPFTREAYFMQSKAFIRMDNWGYAQTILHNFLKITDDPDIQDRIYLDLARLHIQASRQPGTDELDDARRFLEQISQANAKNLKAAELAALIKEARTAPQKNPVLAGLFAIIPGGGFFYCERYKDAVAAFGLNAGLMLAAYTAFDNGNPALGAVIGFVETGFYSGSIYGAVSAAHKHNHVQRVRILNREFNLGTTIDPDHQGVFFSLNHRF